MIMIIPTIHLNGTSKNELLEAIGDALSALAKAKQALGGTAPNARDYYPQGPDAINRAIEEHVERIKRLESIRQELLLLAKGIDAQGRGC